MLRVCPQLCRAITNNIEVRANLSSSQTLNTIIVKRVHKPPLIGKREPLELRIHDLNLKSSMF